MYFTISPESMSVNWDWRWRSPCDALSYGPTRRSLPPGGYSERISIHVRFDAWKSQVWVCSCSFHSCISCSSPICWCPAVIYVVLGFFGINRRNPWHDVPPRGSPMSTSHNSGPVPNFPQWYTSGVTGDTYNSRRLETQRWNHIIQGLARAAIF